MHIIVTNSYRIFQFGYFRQSEVFYRHISAVLIRFNRFRAVNTLQTATTPSYIDWLNTGQLFSFFRVFNIFFEVFATTVRHYRFFLFLIHDRNRTIRKEKIFYAHKIWLYHMLQYIYIYEYIICRIIIYDLAHIDVLYSRRIYYDPHKYSCNTLEYILYTHFILHLTATSIMYNIIIIFFKIFSNNKIY